MRVKNPFTLRFIVVCCYFRQQIRNFGCFWVWKRKKYQNKSTFKFICFDLPGVIPISTQRFLNSTSCFFALSAVSFQFPTNFRITFFLFSRWAKVSSSFFLHLKYNFFLKRNTFIKKARLFYYYYLQLQYIFSPYREIYSTPSWPASRSTGTDINECAFIFTCAEMLNQFIFFKLKSIVYYC